MMLSADRKKALRQFQCDEITWDTFVQMSTELGRGIDELINEAMTSYAQLNGYSGEPTPPPTPGRAAPPPRPPAPPPAATAGRSGRPLPTPAAAAVGLPVPPPPRLSGQESSVSAVPGQVLYLLFDNQKYRIDKDQFIIGRGSKTSDLPIRDGNISRKHAAVIRRNGTFFIKDLGSTNGIDFKGMRIDNKRIEEGDVFHLCDYELRFTYKR